MKAWPLLIVTWPAPAGEKLSEDYTLRVNGRAVRSLRSEWRGISGFVPQQFFLLDDSVRRNVAFGIADQDMDDRRIWEALRLARLDQRIRAMPEQLDTRIGEHGALLSGGECQRLSIARALYVDPEILVLDEATSALDPATETELMKTLVPLARDKAVVVITHRATTAAYCSRALLMREGRIIDRGTFDELAGRNPDFLRVTDLADATTHG